MPPTSPPEHAGAAHATADAEPHARPVALRLAPRPASGPAARSVSRLATLEPARPSAYALLPAELETMRAPSHPGYLFGRLQRPWTWQDGGPRVGAETARFLGRELDLRLPRVHEAKTSTDGATKVALELHDGALVEAVHMPRAVRHPRVTLCVSSQVGCAMGCTFCATAGMGLVRNLTSGEIVGQILALMATLGPARPQDVTVVFMGMGEPLHNFDHLAQAVRVLCHPEGLGLSPNRITVSTSGLVPGIDKLAALDPRPLLAVSLNATTDLGRARTMPVTRAFGLADLRAALARFPLRSHEKVTLEYVLLDGENDTPEDAARLAAWATGFRHNINVIPYNPFPGSPFGETHEPKLQTFVKSLQDLGCLVTVRRSRGRDVDAACGQLARRSADADVARG